MEQWSKIEEAIKNKLDQQTLEPSPDLWSKIETGLEPHNPVINRKKRTSWLLIAASVLVVMGMTAFFLFSSPEAGILKESTKKGFPVVELEEQRIKRDDTIGMDVAKPQTAVEEVLVVSLSNKAFKAGDLKLPDLKSEKPKTPDFSKAYVINDEFDLDSIALLALEATNTNSFKVDPNALLKEVENELKGEYRETVFDQIKRNLKDAKSNFANRNYK